ncbi:endonuclease VII domain-containing protein [Streptomyces poriticola]|uniref:endonuclease VII domain-containing protein n=1 Tax=Streptomyces poriticola TaxID=3120506 RepID=UPI002FCDEBF2
MRDGLQAYCRECRAEYQQAGQVARGRDVRPRVRTSEGHEFRRSRGQVEPHSGRHRSAAACDGLATRCRTSCAAQGREDHLGRKYGLTASERDQLIASQGGVCCTSPAALPEHVDHCHETGRVRGVLCFSCNAALGQFKDRPDAIWRAAAYVEGIAWKPTLVAPGVYQLPS